MDMKKVFINFVAIFAVFIFVLCFSFDGLYENLDFVATLHSRISSKFVFQSDTEPNATSKSDAEDYVLELESLDDVNSTIQWATFDDKCRILLQDPFHLGLDKIVEENVDLFDNCTPKFQVLSSLVNGTLHISREAGNCSYRCLTADRETRSILYDWNVYNHSDSIPLFPACDFVEVNCVEGYNFGHHQIYIPRDEQKRPITDKRPNVYIFGIDAISNQMFHRHLHRTAYFAEHEMAGVNFIHYNKVAKNSIPNQFPATFGKFHANQSNPSEYGPNVVSDFSEEQCRQKIPLDEQFISLVYNESGYRTARLYDDYMVQDLVCKGFGQNIHDHGDNPFFNFFHFHANLREKMLSESCRSDVHYYFDQFINYVKADSKKPKFMLHMVLGVSHNGPEYAATFDKFFHEGFRKNMELFDDDFLIFWSDHGNHFGRIFVSRFGYADTRNPMLVIIPPKRFRKELDHPLYRNLLDNSKKLVSHFDFYATLVDLATVNLDTEDFTQPLTPGMALNRTNNRVKMLKGSSLLRPITRPNKCQAAHIPFHWCLCDYQHFIPDDEKDLAARFTLKMIDGILTEGVEHRERDRTLRKRRRLQIQEVAIKMKEKGKRLFYATLRTPEFVDTHTFKAYLELYPNGTLRLAGIMDGR